ncbi:hypothetical protein RJ639_036086 [Escallonia herrerae]|uniref:8-amino-7-oxononanoate synthase n=1 Tax=Escallonia herrerae TaxID=1293975 RepID=A0AA89B935_9ASTE|nr:hypothetical protein RJ639_036086 [Escallonia herrerae]
MIALKAIQTSFTPTKHAFFHRREPSKRKNSILSLSKPNDSESETPPPEGDTRKQELLARIAMLQTQKVRLTDYLDERSTYLTQFAEEANAEFDQIGEDALKELDEASTRIMENIESRMQAFEESAEANKLEIEKNKEMLEEFEGQIQRGRNEGLFFQNLGQKAPSDKAKAKEEVQKIKELTIGNAGSKTRRNIYLALIGLIVAGIVDSLISSSADWRKVAVLGVILVGLLSQFIYEQNMLSEKNRKQKEITEEKKE